MGSVVQLTAPASRASRTSPRDTRRPRSRRNRTESGQETGLDIGLAVPRIARRMNSRGPGEAKIVMKMTSTAGSGSGMLIPAPAEDPPFVRLGESSSLTSRGSAQIAPEKLRGAGATRGFIVLQTGTWNVSLCEAAAVVGI